MILDLIVILLVIILSYLFCMNDKSKYCMLSHIVIGLTVMVFYKLMRYYKIKTCDNKKAEYISKNKEQFTVDQSLNDFISNTTDVIVTQDQNTLTSSTMKDYTTVINELISQIKTLNSNTASQQEQTTAMQSNTNIDTIGLENQQAFQELQIDYLTKQIQSAQDIINQNTVVNNSVNYKPIKIYSSCVANANGTITPETSVKDKFTGLQPLHSVLNSNAGQQILNTSSQNSQSNLDLPSLLQKLLQTNTN